MVKMRNLVKVGNREVKKRYIGNKLIFEDLGDKTEILSGEEIYTDKADDSVVHVEIDGKSYQHAGSGKNLFDIRHHSYSSTITPNEWGGFDRSGGYGGVTGSEIKVEPNQTYTFSYKVEYGSARQEIYDGDGSILYILGTGRDVSFTPKYSTIRIDMSNASAHNDVDSRITEIQLEKGSVATEYEPLAPSPDYPIEIHSLNDFDVVSSTEKLSEGQLEEYNHDTEYENIYKINLLLSEPLRSVYDVKDRLFRDSDGLWKIERSVGEEVFENGDKWNNDYLFGIETSAVYGISYANASYMKERGIISLSHVPDDRIGPGTDENEGWLQTNPRLRIRLQHIAIGATQPSVSAFKDWLKKEHDNGTPLTIVYELAEPTIEILDQELQDKLNNLRSFQGSNYVYTIINDKTDILPANVAENLKPTLHSAFKSKGWYDYYLKTLLK